MDELTPKDFDLICKGLATARSELKYAGCKEWKWYNDTLRKILLIAPDGATYERAIEDEENEQ